jgi:hypothetical protein
MGSRPQILLRYTTQSCMGPCYPFIGIIEFFLYRTLKYCYERANAAHAAVADSRVLHSYDCVLGHKTKEGSESPSRA